MKSTPAEFDPTQDYPIGERRPDLVRTAAGRPLEAVTLDAVMAGEVEAAEIRISPQALRYQAQVAEAHGRGHLASNFERAAELTAVPDSRILQIYDALRPGRASSEELEAIALELEEQYGAPRTAALVREARSAYERRGVLRTTRAR